MNRLSIVALVLLLTSCITEPEIFDPYVGYQPVPTADNWLIASPDDVGLNADTLASVYRDLYADDDVWMLRSMNVYKNGLLIAESYTKDTIDRTAQRAIWSSTKQVLAILIGIAIDQGLITDVNDPIKEYLPSVKVANPDKADITIRQLLMMTSGIAWENYGIGGDDSQVMQNAPDDLLSFALGKPMATDPGSTFDYKDSDPQILAAVLESVTGERVDVWADRVLFTPIGLRNYSWKRYRDGRTLGAWGLLMPPREMAKVAQLVLSGGEWYGQRIVSASWIETMASPLQQTSDKYFGYLWWVLPDHGTFFMSGNGGQFAFVFPAENAVVTFTAEENVQGPFRLNTFTAVMYAQRALGIYSAD